MKNINQTSKIILFGVVLSRLAMFMSVPFLSIYLSQSVGMNSLRVGLVVGSNSLIGMFSSLIVGKFLDNLPIRKTLIVCPAIWAMVFLAISQVRYFELLLFLNGFNGLLYTVYESTSKKALTLTAVGEEQLLFNLRYFAINVGAIAGPFIATRLGIEVTNIPYLILSVTYIIIAFVNTRLRDIQIFNDRTGKVTSEGTAKSEISKDFIFLLIGIMFSYFGYSQFGSTVAQFLSTEMTDGAKVYGFLLTLSAFIIVSTQFIVLRIFKKWKNKHVLSISNILFSLCIISALLFPNKLSLVGFVCMYSLGEMLLGARFDFTVSTMSAPENKSLYFSLAETVKLGSALGPIFGGFLLLNCTQTVTFIVLGAITLIGSIFLLASGRT